MSLVHPFRRFAPVWISLSAVAFGASAPETTKQPASTTRSSSTAARSPARGPIPDPTLLDGSGLPADQKGQEGMLGDFEIPGDPNVRNGRVGGGRPQSQMPMPSMPGGSSG